MKVVLEANFILYFPFNRMHSMKTETIQFYNVCYDLQQVACVHMYLCMYMCVHNGFKYVGFTLLTFSQPHFMQNSMNISFWLEVWH